MSILYYYYTYLYVLLSSKLDFIPIYIIYFNIGKSTNFNVD